MGFAVGFITGATNEANRERDANQTAQNDYLANSMQWFDSQVKPAYDKQQKAAQDVTDRYNTYKAYSGPDGLTVDDSVAAQAAVDGKDHDPIDLINQTRQTMAQRAKQAAQQQQAQAQQPQQNQSGQQGGTFQPNAGPNNQQPAQEQPQDQNGVQRLSPQAEAQLHQQVQQGQQPQASAPQQQAPVGQTNQASPQQGQQPVDPQQQKFNAERGVMNQIGALLTGQVGTEDQRQMFLQQAASKYGLDEGKIRDMIRQYNNPQSTNQQFLQQHNSGQVAATPTLDNANKYANTYSNPDAMNKFMQGDLSGAQTAQDASDTEDYEQQRHDSLADQRSMSDYNFQHQKELQNMKNEAGTPDPKTIETIAGQIANYDMAPPSSYAITKDPEYWTAVMDRVKGMTPDYSAQNYVTSQSALTSFAKERGDQVRAFNVAIQHLDTLKNAYAALQNGDQRAISKYSNMVADQMGVAAPNTVNAIGRLVGQELTKAVVGSRSTGAEREEAAHTVATDLSNSQLNDVIDKYESLMAGQMNGLKQQYQSGTRRKDFDNYLLPETKQVMANHGYSTDGTQSQQAVQPPPAERMQGLKPGMVRTFQNGTRWTVDNDGNPKQVGNGSK